MHTYTRISAFPRALGLFQKKIPMGGGGGGEEGKQYIFLWVVGADIFQIIWVIGV